MTAEQIISIVLTAFLGGSGLVGMAFWLWKRVIEKREKKAEEAKAAAAAEAAEELAKKEDTREQIKYLVDHGKVVDATLKAMVSSTPTTSISIRAFPSLSVSMESDSEISPCSFF